MERFCSSSVFKRLFDYIQLANYGIHGLNAHTFAYMIDTKWIQLVAEWDWTLLFCVFTVLSFNVRMMYFCHILDWSKFSEKDATKKLCVLFEDRFHREIYKMINKIYKLNCCCAKTQILYLTNMKHTTLSFWSVDDIVASEAPKTPLLIYFVLLINNNNRKWKNIKLQEIKRNIKPPVFALFLFPPQSIGLIQEIKYCVRVCVSCPFKNDVTVIHKTSIHLTTTSPSGFDVTIKIKLFQSVHY